MRHNLVTFDDDTLVVTEPAPIKRSRGRPAGSKSRTVVGHSKSFTTADFAFMKAHMFGMELRQAASRYLLHLNITTKKEASAYFDALIERLASGDDEGVKINPEAEGYIRESISVVLAWRSDVIALQEQKGQVAAKTKLPTLDEFIEQTNMDGFSESEVIEAYQEKYADELAAESTGTSPTSEDPFSSKRLIAVADAISSLQGMISVSPSGKDSVKAWLAPALATSFLPFGVITLADLCNWINLTGRGWYTKVRSIGRSKAMRLLYWLSDNEQGIGVALSELVRASMPADDALPSSDLVIKTGSDNTEVSTWGTVTYGIVPIEQLDWPVHLRGHDGLYRSLNPNTLGATDDADAIRKWLSRFKDSPSTLDSYSRAVELLVLWAVVEKGKAISSLSEIDLREFKAFISAPPAHWVQTARVTKSSKHWRPLRGKLSDSSVVHYMRAVTALFNALCDSDYMSANPAKGLIKNSRTEVELDTTRSLSNQDIGVIGATLAAMEDSPRKRRFRALLLLLQSTGLRKSELCALRWSSLSRIRLDNNESDMWQVTFVGKGKKARSLPITHQTYRALRAHKEDRMQLAETKKLAYLRDIEEGSWPLIGILDESAAQEREGKESENIYDAYRPANKTGELSGQRVHAIVKDFFRACAQKAVEMGRDSSNFEKASLHWMRHTFAHQVLAATDKDLAVVQQLLGHSSIAVTGLYVKADMSQRMLAVNKVAIEY